MSRFLLIFIIVLLVACGNSADKGMKVSSDGEKKIKIEKVMVDTVISQLDKARYREGELLIKFKPDFIKANADKIHKAVGATVIKSLKGMQGIELVKLPDNVSVKEALSYYISLPQVEYAQPNFIKKPLGIPNDTYFGDQWALHNTGRYAGGTYDADIDAPEAWDITSGNYVVNIAVIDTGIYYTHPDLVGNIWQNPNENCNNGIDDDGNGYVDDCVGWNFFDDNPYPIDDMGHGTHVAGIIGARGHNHMGTAGVIWYVKMIPLKFIGYHENELDCGGDTHWCGDTAGEIEAIDYAIRKGAKIINASFGSYDFDPLEFNKIAEADGAGILFVAAAGNDANNNDLLPLYPASYNLPNIISVAATDQNDRRASFSNWGPGTVHVSAPGVYILSTVPNINTYSMCTGSVYAGYDFCSGTSMAAPHVSGLAGLLWTYYSWFNHYQVKWTILRYVDPSPLSGWILTGGRINAYKALSSLLTPENLTATGTSTSEVTLSWIDRATGEDGYRVEWKPSGGSTYTLLATLPANSNTFRHTGLADGSINYYRVRAFNNIPAESMNAEVVGAPKLNPPSNLKATKITSSEVSLNWVDNSSSESGFKIERKMGDGSYEEIGTVGANVTSYDDLDLPRGNYTYRVKAYNSVTTSSYSNESRVSLRRGGGGGGCSIGGSQDVPDTIASILVFLLPFIFISILRYKKN